MTPTTVQQAKKLLLRAERLLDLERDVSGHTSEVYKIVRDLLQIMSTDEVRTDMQTRAKAGTKRHSRASLRRQRAGQ